jgi:hypothetical protein
MARKPYSVQLIELRYKRSFVDLCRELRGKGMTWRQIGAKLGVSHMTAYEHGRSCEHPQEELTAAR